MRKRSSRSSATLKEQVEETKQEIEQAERAADYGKAAELRYGVLAGLERDLAAVQAQLAQQQEQGQMLAEEVTPQDIAEIVGRWTGIPVSSLDGERD